MLANSKPSVTVLCPDVAVNAAADKTGLGPGHKKWTSG